MHPPEFWSGKTLPAQMTAAALAPLGYVYGASIAWKHRFSSPRRSPAAVICVGNLTVGGTGKTPVAMALARMLRERSVPVAFLSRGYGRKHGGPLLVGSDHDVRDVGDEALLLVQTAPTIVSRDRAEGAKRAEVQGARLLIMDDGHQNFSLAKDLSIIVVDGQTGFGNGRILPAGPLREPVSQGLRRADAVVIMGEGSPDLAGFAGPVLRARLEPARGLDGRRYVAFAGIGRPDKFFAMLRAGGAELVSTHAFADHHVYSEKELSKLRKAGDETKSALITTEKDSVRIAAVQRKDIEVLRVEVVFEHPAAIEELLAPVLAKARIGS